MIKKNKNLLLILIFIVVFSFNLIYSFQIDHFANDNAYNNLRKINSITETGSLSYYDEYSYGGREHVIPPIFYYIISFFGIIIGTTISAKIIPSLMISSIIIITYLISKKITKNNNISLLSSFMSGFVPIITKLTLNTINIHSLSIPLLFLSLYYFMKISEEEDNENKYVIYFIITFLISLLTSTTTILLLGVLLIYLLINKIEETKIKNKEIETILFSTFFLIWAYFLMYKNVLLDQGPQILWEGIPSIMRAEYFSDFNILIGIIGIGLIPFLFGTYSIYLFFYKEKRKTNYLYISLALFTIMLLWARLIQIEVGLSILSITMIILFSYFYKSFINYLNKTKFKKYENKILFLILIIFIITSVIPSIYTSNENNLNSFNDDEKKAFEWIKENLPEGSTILANVHYGGFITINNMKNVVDTDFVLAPKPDERLKDIRTIYQTNFETEAIRLIDKYNINYIIISPRLKKYYNIKNIKYENPRCFERVYNEKIIIIKSKCTLKSS